MIESTVHDGEGRDPKVPVRDASTLMPKQPIDRLVRPVAHFLHIEATSGIVLMICTVVAIGLANSPWADSYLSVWKTEVGFSFGSWEFQHSLRHIINDGLMALFFFVIGLEVKRELVHGALADIRSAILPIAAALGGMVVPAGIYLALQYDQPAARGWGIPMATDIAFVVGCLALLGSRVPNSLRVLLLSLAIVDDIGAIIVIAIGYTNDLDLRFLMLAGVGIGIVHFFSRVGIRRFPPYIVAGLVAWFAFHESGVHATLAGVILGLMTPAKATIVPSHFYEYLNSTSESFGGGDWTSFKGRAAKVREVQRLTRETVSPLEYLETTLHPWSSFLIIPVFALANAGVPFELANVSDPVAIAVVLGLLVGKPVGVLLFSAVTVWLGWAKMPERLTWRILTAGSFLAGIGFTMALFIDGLAFGDEGFDTAKTGVLIGSGLSAVCGMVLLLVMLPKAGVSRSEAS
ncbi:Na(+)/H(+) antiporter NhaA [Novipirellula galeiformis]|uniref:Na(+)/H(+) antiporter NhaA n=2 Tax=Novipirellula galeiformis TaxID=2528004 RepID=A0A5C6C1W4_9BACT|nr:Na(+)/H(+) antiporter NhaA [Novipirellula galeiformis]